MPTGVPQLVGGTTDFFVGLFLPLRSLSILLRDGKLFVLGLLSAAVTCLALIGVGWAAYTLPGHWVGEGSWWRGLLSVLLGFIVFVVGALTLPPLLLAPLQDPISEATEQRIGGFTPPPFSLQRLVRSAATSIGHTLSRAFLMLACFLVLLPLNLVPGIGSVLYGVLSSAWAMWWLTAEYLSGPMARHLLPFRDVLKTMRAHPAVCLGFGLALYVMLWVPVLNFFLVPLAVVGGTLLYRALIPQVP